MADDGSAQSATVWPMPRFYFQVKFDSEVISCKEVVGLDAETQIIEYRSGDSKGHYSQKMPGLKKFGNITIKKGVFQADNKFWDWFNQLNLNVIKRIPLTVSLLDESASPVAVWSITNAFPIKVSSPELNAEGNEVAIESIEIACETIDCVNA